MSSPFVHISGNPQDTKRLLGIDYEHLQQLTQNAELKHLEMQKNQEESKTRIIAKGGGRKPSLSIAEQIVLTLTYLRQHPTFQMLGVMFGVSESSAHNIFHYWLNILQELLPESIFAQLENCQNDWEVVQEILEEKELIIDSSEQERERPGDNQEQKRYYSGYKKTLV
jgi:hypothetical protein